MADTEREKRKKVFEDFMKPYKKEDKKAKKKDKKAKTKAEPSKKKKKKYKAEDLTERELDIDSDRDTKSIAERVKNIGDLSEKGKRELLYDMSKRGLDLSNRERSRLGLPPLGKDPFTYRGPGKKSGGKVYSRGSRKANYNG